MKSRYCYGREELTNFINDNNIAKDDITQIVLANDGTNRFVVFYWEYEKSVKTMNG